VTLSFSAARNGSRFIEVTFPFELSELRLTPGLLEEEVRHYPLSSFEFQEGKITLPLANGLFGLGANLWLIKDTRYVHLGLRFWEGETVVRFQDETNGPDDPATWRFYCCFSPGAADAARLQRVRGRRAGRRRPAASHRAPGAGILATARLCPDNHS
jgi:hypothetical protein